MASSCWKWRAQAVRRRRRGGVPCVRSYRHKHGFELSPVEKLVIVEVLCRGGKQRHVRVEGPAETRSSGGGRAAVCGATALARRSGWVPTCRRREACRALLTCCVKKLRWSYDSSSSPCSARCSSLSHNLSESCRAFFHNTHLVASSSAADKATNATTMRRADATNRVIIKQ